MCSNNGYHNSNALFNYYYDFHEYVIYSFITGLHLEGPFINKDKKGAHKELFIEALDSQRINKMTEHYGTLDFVKIITMAPEQPFALETIKDLTKGGITVSIG